LKKWWKVSGKKPNSDGEILVGLDMAERFGV